MKSFSRHLVLLSTALFLSGGAHAAGSMDPREACRNDAKNFCGDVQPGGGRIINCLWDHYKDVSDDCYSAMQQMETRRNAQGNGQGNDGPPPPPSGGQGGMRGMNGGPPPGPPPGGDGNGPPPGPPPNDN